MEEKMLSNSELRANLKNLLEQSILAVTFTKKDGTERTMICTRNFGIMENKTGKNVRAEVKDAGSFNPDVCRAYDLEKEDWRSFRVDSVKNIILVG